MGKKKKSEEKRGRAQEKAAHKADKKKSKKGEGDVGFEIYLLYLFWYFETGILALEYMQISKCKYYQIILDSLCGQLSVPVIAFKCRRIVEVQEHVENITATHWPERKKYKTIVKYYKFIT